MSVRSLSLCYLVAIWFETLLYGVYIVFLIPTVNVLLFRPLSTRYVLGSGPQFNLVYLAGIFALWAFCTIHVGAGLNMLLEAFVLFPEMSSESYFAVWTSPLNTLRTSAFLAIIAVSDAFMIFRVYVLWFRSVIVTLVPLVTLTIVVVSGILIFTHSSQVPQPLPSLSTSSVSINFSDARLTPILRILLPIHIAMSFITNSWITIFAGIKLWRAGNLVKAQGGWHYRRRMIVVFGETGLVYPLAAGIALILTVTGSNAQVIPFTALAPLAAILPSLMILTIELGYTTCLPDSSTPHLGRQSERWWTETA